MAFCSYIQLSYAFVAMCLLCKMCPTLKNSVLMKSETYVIVVYQLNRLGQKMFLEKEEEVRKYNEARTDHGGAISYIMSITYIFILIFHYKVVTYNQGLLSYTHSVS